MENVLRDLPNVIVYLDDILVTGANEEEHLKTLAEVLGRLERAGLRAQKQKCKFMSSSVTYLGHMIDQHGLHPLQEKVRAVKDAPYPKNMSELKSFLGLLTYYSKFWPNMAHMPAPLYGRISGGDGLKQKREHFKQPKICLRCPRYYPELDLILTCDASSWSGPGTSHA